MIFGTGTSTGTISAIAMIVINAAASVIVSTVSGKRWIEIHAYPPEVDRKWPFLKYCFFFDCKGRKDCSRCFNLGCHAINIDRELLATESSFVLAAR